MILAVMTRATLGHAGRALRADRATVALYAAIILAALTRIAAAFLPGMTMTLLVLSGALWFAWLSRLRARLWALSRASAREGMKVPATARAFVSAYTTRSRHRDTLLNSNPPPCSTPVSGRRRPHNKTEQKNDAEKA